MVSELVVNQVSLLFESEEFARGLVEGLRKPCPIEAPATEAEIVSTVRGLRDVNDSTLRYELGKLIGIVIRSPFVRREELSRCTQSL